MNSIEPLAPGVCRVHWRAGPPGLSPGDVLVAARPGASPRWLAAADVVVTTWTEQAIDLAVRRYTEDLAAALHQRGPRPFTDRGGPLAVPGPRPAP
ncbi:hypothetical protein [Actinokineospora bangkokensis]|uniref:Uncharacterized protein n=1 Tax=Actinokineospora bangkokensis TaxID=1193682 RepID=A0A1Q9LCC1_9PSEU|nr:hypothetical protein [Actinokineospora bangkokensis]OLR89664.1 hypothetical protein BJP25_04720 [Actinokineospora bangkokensis]